MLLCSRGPAGIHEVLDDVSNTVMGRSWLVTLSSSRSISLIPLPIPLILWKEKCPSPPRLSCLRLMPPWSLVLESIWKLGAELRARSTMCCPRHNDCPGVQSTPIRRRRSDEGWIRNFLAARQSLPGCHGVVWVMVEPTVCLILTDAGL